MDLPAPEGADIVNACLALLIHSPHPETPRFLPALTIGNKEIDEMAEILRGVLKRVM